MEQQKKLPLSKQGKYFIEDLRDLPHIQSEELQSLPGFERSWLKIQDSQHRVWLSTNGYRHPIRPVYGASKYLVKIQEHVNGEWVLTKSYEPPTKLSLWRWLTLTFDNWIDDVRPLYRIKFIGYVLLLILGFIVAMTIMAVVGLTLGEAIKAVLEFLIELFSSIKALF